MESSNQKFVAKCREFKEKNFLKWGRFFYDLGISANTMTTISLILGILTVYFLFSNHLLFVVFAILHLIADGLDGLIAKASQPTKFGQYYDLITDRTIAIITLIKLGWYLQDYYVYIILGLLIITQLVYFSSKFEYPVVFVRTGLLIPFMFYPIGILFHPIGNTFILTATCLIVGGFIVYSLALQLQHFVKEIRKA